MRLMAKESSQRATETIGGFLEGETSNWALKDRQDVVS